jgi:peptidoglycan/xylan/chitin deacetylase (PgdA/CDA1 family)
MIKRLIIILFLFPILVTLANAYIPVTYSCCIDYTSGEGTLLDGFDNIIGWTVDNGSAKEADVLNFKEGKQGLKLISIKGSDAYIDKSININFSDTNNFAVWAYVNNASNSSYIRLYITSNGTKWTSYFSDSEYGDVKTGWNKLLFNRNDFVNHKGESWNNPMNRIRLRIGTVGNKDLNVTFDDFRYNVTGKRAKLIIQFDDGLDNVYTNAFPILQANNQTAVAFVTTSYIGTSGHMTLDNLRVLQDAGWDISSHTVDHPHLPKLKDTMLSYELNSSYDWLVINKFQKSAGFIAYPFGEFNNEVINKTKSRYILGRSTIPDSYQQHINSDSSDSQLYIQKTINLVNTSTVQITEDLINDTIDSKNLGILVYHGIVDSNPGEYQNLKVDLHTISDYLKCRSNDIDIITYSDLMVPNIVNFTPVINKTTRIYYNGSSVLMIKNKYDEYMPNMAVTPSSGFIDIYITRYSDQLIKFNESNSSSRILYSIGGLIPYSYYSVQLYFGNDSLYQSFNVLSNSTGYISYYMVGSKNNRYQLIRPVLSLNYFIGIIIVLVIAIYEIVYHLRKKRNINVRNSKT